MFWLQESAEKEKKKKQVVKSIELPIEALTFGFSQVELNQYTEQEFKMIAADRQEKERADARNALEEYVYELRGKLSSDDELAPYVLENERSALISQLDEMENWLYEEGEDCNRQVYQDRLAELKAKGEPIQTRKIEAELRPIVIEDFAKTLQLGVKVVEQMKWVWNRILLLRYYEQLIFFSRAKNPKYAHLTDEEIQKVEQQVYQSFQWLEQARAKTINAPKHLPPPITVQQIRQEKANYESVVMPIINKPQPKAPSPPKEESKNAQQQQNNQQQQQQPQQQEKGQNQSDSQDNMEWSST